MEDSQATFTADRLVLLAQRIRPELRLLPAGPQQQTFAEMIPLLFTAPLALAGLVWLLLATEWQALPVTGGTLLLLAAAGYLFARYAPVFWLDVTVEARLKLIVTLWPLVVWAAVLSLGVNGLWLAVIWPLFYFRWSHRYSLELRYPLRLRPHRLWMRLSALSQSLAVVALPGLIALTAYRAWGGVTPLPGWRMGEWLPAFYATGLMALLPALNLLPVTLYLRRFAGAEVEPGLWRRFVGGAAAFLLASYLFALPGARLYAAGGATVFLFYVLGAWLATLAAYGLSQALERHRQERRKLVQLEQLAQALLNAPIDDPDLPAILELYMPAILGHSWLEIRLFPAAVLFRQQGDWPEVEAEVWQKLVDSHAPFLLLPMAARAIERREALNAILVPIVSAGDAMSQRIGGIYLVMHRHLGEPATWLPALQSVAGQIAATVYRVEGHRRILDYQAQLYQQEVYAQSYKAEAYAQKLAYQQVVHELQLAGQIQASFLPRFVPEVAGWQITVTLEPARDASGDFYDFIQLPDGRLGLLMADVAGKGIGAAMYMAMSATLIRTYALEYGAEPARVLAAANARILADTHSDWFVTVFYGVLEPQTGILTYCNAGHNPPFLWHAATDQPMQALTRTGLPLGLFDTLTWEQNEARLACGDVLVLYTDGVTEAQDEAESLFGEQRLQQVVETNLGRPAEVVEFKVIMAVEDFVGDAPQFDDIALMVVTRETPEATRTAGDDEIETEFF